MKRYNIDPEARAEEARANFYKGYNCTQSVLLAYLDVLGLTAEKALEIGSGFGGGMGRLREVCGSVSGMFMVAGCAFPAINPNNMEERKANYAVIQNLAAQFKEINGSIVCRELLAMGTKKASDHQMPTTEENAAQECATKPTACATESPMPSMRTPEYYHKRPCPELIAISARLVGEMIMECSLKEAAEEK